MMTLPHQNPVINIAWSPTRFGLLSTLTKDSSVVQLYDIQHAQWGKNCEKKISDDDDDDNNL